MNDKLTGGFALCGSFCTFKTAIEALRELMPLYNIIPIMSEAAFSTDTRFGTAAEHTGQITRLCGREILHTIAQAEPIGPKKLLDFLLIAPATGNTISKLALGITDTSVTMAAKAHLRNGRPLIIAVSTNDGLSGSAEHISRLSLRKNVYFVPYGQDDAAGKPTSLVADFSRLGETIAAALDSRQVQPVLV
ncbi:MAG: dipicolinate synthase subunit B [Oscillospiraceae bacterium]|jgi:dipicolinate synthase subunit B|nr:dipicolinate synthase subunit B [Oscillospiraceae bacterium]